MSEQEPFVTINDVADHYAVSVSTVRTWVREGKIPKSSYIKLGKTYRFSLSAITAALLIEASEDNNDSEQLSLDFGEETENSDDSNEPINLFPQSS